MYINSSGLMVKCGDYEFEDYRGREDPKEFSKRIRDAVHGETERLCKEKYHIHPWRLSHLTDRLVKIQPYKDGAHIGMDIHDIEEETEGKIVILDPFIYRENPGDYKKECVLNKVLEDIGVKGDIACYIANKMTNRNMEGNRRESREKKVKYFLGLLDFSEKDKGRKLVIEAVNKYYLDVLSAFCKFLDWSSNHRFDEFIPSVDDFVGKRTDEEDIISRRKQLYTIHLEKSLQGLCILYPAFEERLFSGNEEIYKYLVDRDVAEYFFREAYTNGLLILAYTTILSGKLSGKEDFDNFDNFKGVFEKLKIEEKRNVEERGFVFNGEEGEYPKRQNLPLEAIWENALEKYEIDKLNNRIPDMKEEEIKTIFEYSGVNYIL